MLRKTNNKLIKKSCSLLAFALILIFSCGYTFSDNLPDSKKINSYSLTKFQFQKTKLNDFKKDYPDAKVHDISKDTKIISVKPAKTDVYNNINVGFSKNLLDWLEFTFAKNIDVKELTAIYGQPESIDTKHSPILDYFNYDTFNISVDKKHIYAKSICVFDTKSDKIANNLRNKIDITPAKKFFGVFPYLKPGITIESEFTKNYPDQLPYMEGEFEVVSTYTLTDELGESAKFYEKAELRFENGLLTWINLFPNEVEAKNILKKLTSPYKVEKLDKKLDFYVFDNYIFTVERNQKKVKNIGLFESDSKF